MIPSNESRVYIHNFFIRVEAITNRVFKLDEDTPFLVYMVKDREKHRKLSVVTLCIISFRKMTDLCYDLYVY